jgi:hypothetical protein
MEPDVGKPARSSSGRRLRCRRVCGSSGPPTVLARTAHAPHLLSREGVELPALPVGGASTSSVVLCLWPPTDRQLEGAVQHPCTLSTVAGLRLQQRSRTAGDGSARLVVEVVVKELGPSLRWATATYDQGDAQRRPVANRGRAVTRAGAADTSPGRVRR